jgi:hypothetical protein
MKPAGKLVVVKLLNVVPIPARFGVNPETVQRINRPFEASVAGGVQ